jgi:adenosylcobinamide-GDP ribazoletransferase
VGLLIGLLLAACSRLLDGLSDPLSATLLLTLWVAASGGLHLDGLADSADAWLGGLGDRERTLAIMHDPRSGPLAIVVLVLLLLLKFAALESLLSQRAATLLIAAPLLGRTALVALFLTTPYVRPGGLGSLLAQHLSRGASLGVILLVAILLIVWLGAAGIYLCLAASIAFLLLRRLMMRRLGGTTGDTAGALLEISETLALVTAAVVC